MDPRFRALTDVDPRGVALPHGTEVLTRVDRIVGERTLSKGTIGRVGKLVGDEVDVSIVGVGVVRFARGDLVPRRVGQAAFAVRRASAWDALAACRVLESVVGSRAWGLDDESSDEDRRGVFAPPLDWSLGLVDPPEDLVSSDGSTVCWSASKAIAQGLRADPNTLEMLFVEATTPLDPIGAWILEERDAFVSREIHGTFVRYAVSQLHRLEQSARLASHRALLLDWLKDDPALALEGAAERLAALSPRAAPSHAERVSQSREWIKQVYRSLHDQGLLAAKDFDALRAFARGGGRADDLPRELRPKNAYNLLRLILVARDWLAIGRPALRMQGAARDRLLAIKRGQVELSEVLREAEAALPELEEARRRSPLPARPDVARADALQRRIGQEIARRAVHRVPGPWGADAVPPPPVTWSDGP